MIVLEPSLSIASSSSRTTARDGGPESITSASSHCAAQGHQKQQQQQASKVFLAEPLAFYQLQSGVSGQNHCCEPLLH
jgi:hypothetical protein